MSANISFNAFNWCHLGVSLGTFQNSSLSAPHSANVTSTLVAPRKKITSQKSSSSPSSHSESTPSPQHSRPVAPALKLDGITLSFGGVKAIKDVSFVIPAREIFAIIGPNGAGKSSLLNIINGVYRANSGSISFEGHRLRSIHPLRAARLGIGRTFQHNALFKQLSTLDNILAGLTRHSRTTLLEHALGLPRDRSETRDFHHRADEIISFLELDAYRNSIVSTLPYGIQKRIDLARSLVGRPVLLLLDEPMAGMNHEEKQDMSRFIRQINETYGTTIVLIEHDIGVVMNLSHHIVVLDNGSKIADGTPEEVRASQAVIDAYLGVAHPTN